MIRISQTQIKATWRLIGVYWYLGAQLNAQISSLIEVRLLTYDQMMPEIVTVFSISVLRFTASLLLCDVDWNDRAAMVAVFSRAADKERALLYHAPGHH